MKQEKKWTDLKTKESEKTQKQLKKLQAADTHTNYVIESSEKCPECQSMLLEMKLMIACSNSECSYYTKKAEVLG